MTTQTSMLEPEITIADEIAELDRELQLRSQVYPRWISQGRLSQAKADRQMKVLHSAIQRLRMIKVQNASVR